MGGEKFFRILIKVLVYRVVLIGGMDYIKTTTIKRNMDGLTICYQNVTIYLIQLDLQTSTDIFAMNHGNPMHMSINE